MEQTRYYAPVRLAVCFDGRIVIHDHRSRTPSERSPLSHVSNTTHCIYYAFLVAGIHLTHSSQYPQQYSLSPRANALSCHITPKHVFHRFPIPPLPPTEILELEFLIK